jgi:cytochrome c oxidase subunit II
VRRLLLVAVGLALVAAIVAPSALAQFTPVTPESPNADGIRTSYLFITIFTVAIFVLVEGLLIAFIWKYRRRKRPRFEDGAPVHGATRLELAWTAGPVIVLFIIAVFVFAELPGIKNIPTATAGQEQLEIKVTGRQFYWQFDYPNGVVAIDTMRAPAGVPVKLVVTSPDTDVIHSWWIPALGGKIDAIPGRTNQTWFQANKPGTYKGQCAELCGLEHAQMLASVDVMPPSEFTAWLEQRRTDQTAATGDLGKETWGGVCAKCHGLAGEGGIGPRIAGSPTLANEQSLETLLRNGRTGPQGVMPAVGSEWSDQQIASLVNYLKENPPSGNPG